MEVVRPDGENRLLIVTATPRYHDGKYVGAFGVFRDITEQQRLQDQLIQSQRIQSLGTLAGGVAHDFNNILSIILGYTTELEKGRLEPARHAGAIRTIQNAVGRGAALVQQILTFARRTDVTFEPVILPDLVRELIPMLERTFPKFITFRREFEKDLPVIHADHTQIHQALLNLCVNARDAMPRGGEILIRLSTFSPQEVASRFSEAENYRYVCLAVSDSGTGMDEATRSRVFDPFFTTKGMGKGTGLGLSVVYGIVQSHKGFIEVESKPDIGSTFRLYFPARVDVVARRLDEERDGEIPGGTETILLVEDEDPMRNLMRMRLEAKGYTVIEARDGLQAVESFSRHQHEIALVFTDLGLPGMAGDEVYRKIRETSPDVRVIFAGGFVMPETKSELAKEGGDTFFQKPYHPSQVLAAIRLMLDSKSFPPHGMNEKQDAD
jgi:signal transduction histidine kinase/ActR/RegA family two-component response regulator